MAACPCADPCIQLEQQQQHPRQCVMRMLPNVLHVSKFVCRLKQLEAAHDSAAAIAVATGLDEHVMHASQMRAADLSHMWTCMCVRTGAARGRT